MIRFDTVLVVDWSAAADRGPRPCKDAIWIGVARDGVASQPIYCRNRIVAETTLATLIEAEQAAGRRVLASFDFPFGYPQGFVAAVIGSPDPLHFWSWLEARITDDASGRNNRFEVAEAINAALSPGAGPFWGKPWQWSDRYPGIPTGKARVGFAPFGEYRACETYVRDTAGKRTSSCFQMNASPTVGGPVLTGLPALERLRRRLGAAVWPFQETCDAPVVLAEIWPSLIDDAVRIDPDNIRDRAQVRLLSLALARLEPARLAALMDVPEIAREEAWILGAGHHGTLLAALRQTKVMDHA